MINLLLKIYSTSSSSSSSYQSINCLLGISAFFPYFIFIHTNFELLPSINVMACHFSSEAQFRPLRKSMILDQKFKWLEKTTGNWLSFCHWFYIKKKQVELSEQLKCFWWELKCWYLYVYHHVLIFLLFSTIVLWLNVSIF